MTWSKVRTALVAVFAAETSSPKVRAASIALISAVVQVALHAIGY